MSDLNSSPSSPNRSDVVGSVSQLPVSCYFDKALLKREQELLFARGPKYVGHRLSVPEIGNYYALPQEGQGRALVHTPQGVELLSNVCRHRQAVILQGRGNTASQIVCPLHRWTYDTSGKLLGAPHFACNPALNLENFPLKQWHGLLFEDNGRDIAKDLAGMKTAQKLQFDNYVLDHVELHQCDYNWKTFIEVYLEDYHVGPFHPGLGNFVTCDDLQWEFGSEYSVQTVGVANRLGKAGSPVYERWQKELLRYQQGVVPEQGAIWLTYYPNIMVEWYPHVLTVSTLYPQAIDKTLNIVEFYYPEEIVAFERDFVLAQRAAYMETCVEDDEIALRMDAGRRALQQRGENEFGPYQSPMEDGMQHFHQWYRRAMGMQVQT